MVCPIRAGGDCVRVGPTDKNILIDGMVEQERGEGKKYLKKGGKLGQGLGALKHRGGGTGTPLQSIIIY